MKSALDLLNKTEKKNNKKFNKSVTFKVVQKTALLAKKHSELLEDWMGIDWGVSYPTACEG